MVHGIPHDSTLTAQNIIADLGALLFVRPWPGKRPAPPTANPGPGIATGLVSDVHAGGFTVDRPRGPQVQVTTSPATVVDTMVASSAGHLTTGTPVIAVGHSQPDGALAASTVEQGTTLPQIESAPSRSAAGGCDPSSVASALALGS